MNNKQTLPFERNRYYVGKMLTSADFQAEQKYMNDKRRFQNSMMFGSGIVCGLSVFNLDDLSVLVESGVAIDGLGREVVVASAIVEKLSAIKGFEQLSSDTVSLCLRYREKDVQSVYAVYRQEGREEYEYNHIREGFELYLTDAGQFDGEEAIEPEFLIKEILLQTTDYRIELIMPATASRECKFRIEIKVIKLSEAQSELSYQGVLQMPAFCVQGEKNKLPITIKKLKLEEGRTFVKEYWVEIEDQEVQNTEVIMQGSAVEAYIDGRPVEAATDVTIKIAVEDCSPGELAVREAGKVSLEMQNMGKAKEYIHLADLKLVRTDSAYIIEEIIEKGIKKYLEIPAREAMRREYLEYFKAVERKETEKQTAFQDNNNSGNAEIHGKVPKIATGTLEIVLGDTAHKGEIYYSGEIMHGLGKGNIVVTLGYEYLEEDRAMGANTKSTIYGSQTLFQRDNPKLFGVETAVKVLNDKGSFLAAVRLQEEVSCLMLEFRWMAVKYPTPEEPDRMQENDGKKIMAETPTVVLGTKESHFFAVRFINMEDCSCSLAYELTEAGSGTISADGVYTAPGRAGVYEIHIYCTDMPIIQTYAYAIVKKKGAEDENHDL